MVRLVNGGHNCEGRVEICHNGQWGTVCDDSWGLPEAQVNKTAPDNNVVNEHNYNTQVACSQVGCGAATSAPHRARFGYGTGPIWLDNVACSADDSSLDECRHNGWGSHNCGHSEDASAICERMYNNITVELYIVR